MKLSILLEGTKVKLNRMEQMDPDAPCTVWIDVAGKEGWSQYRYDNVLYDDYDTFCRMVKYGDGYKALNWFKKYNKGIKV